MPYAGSGHGSTAPTNRGDPLPNPRSSDVSRLPCKCRDDRGLTAFPRVGLFPRGRGAHRHGILHRLLPPTEPEANSPCRADATA